MNHAYFDEYFDTKIIRYTLKYFQNINILKKSFRVMGPYEMTN